MRDVNLTQPELRINRAVARNFDKTPNQRDSNWLVQMLALT
jgi:hypothetical protein